MMDNTTTLVGMRDQVIEIVRETMALPPEVEISGAQLLFYDLQFTSMDLLDLLFRLEQHFHIAIPEGTLYRLARGDSADAQFVEKGTLTAFGREKFMQLLYDTPAAIFPDRVHISTLPKFCTIDAMVRLVEHLLGNAHV